MIQGSIDTQHQGHHIQEELENNQIRNGEVFLIHKNTIIPISPLFHVSLPTPWGPGGLYMYLVLFIYCYNVLILLYNSDTM